MSNKLVTAKFGGSSGADAKCILGMVDIIDQNSGCSFVAVSAPGKSKEYTVKITDQLLELFKVANPKNDNWMRVWDKIQYRFKGIIYGLGLEIELKKLLPDVRNSIAKNLLEKDFIVSRGEYLQAQILTAYFKKVGRAVRFVDTDKCIFFTNDKIDEVKTHNAIKKLVKKDYLHIFPGFYGVDEQGKIKTFSRGGSDLTGAIVAAATGSHVYENWTDVSGFYTANPKEIKEARPISRMTYKEARVLSYAGATVLHQDTMSYLSHYKIDLHIRNTKNPNSIGTKIFETMLSKSKGIVGIVGQKGYSVLSVTKIGAHDLVGFGASILQVFADENIPYEYELPSGIDESWFAIKTDALKNREVLIDQIKKVVNPDSVNIEDAIGVINTITYTPSDYSDILLVLERNSISRISSSYTGNGQVIITLPERFIKKATDLIHNRFFY